MITKTDILAMVRSVTKRSHGIAETKTIDPYREWFIGIGIFVLVSLVGGVITMRTYVQYNIIETGTQLEVQPVESYRSTVALTALEKFKARKAAYDQLAVPSTSAEVDEETTSVDDAATSTESDPQDPDDPALDAPSEINVLLD